MPFDAHARFTTLTDHGHARTHTQRTHGARASPTAHGQQRNSTQTHKLASLGAVPLHDAPVGAQSALDGCARGARERAEVDVVGDARAPRPDATAERLVAKLEDERHIGARPTRRERAVDRALVNRVGREAARARLGAELTRGGGNLVAGAPLGDKQQRRLGSGR